MKTLPLYILLVLVTWGTAAHAQQRVFVADIGFAGTLSESDVMRADSLLLETPYDVTFMPGLQHLTLTHPQPFVPEDVVQALRDLGLFAGLIETNFLTSKAGTSTARNVGMYGAKRAYAIALPVELVEFNGTEGKDAHVLEWQTQTELNNAYFEVERSRNGNLWQTVAHVEGHGNSTVPHYYRFDDVERPYGTTYYRLRQVDFNSAFEYSETIALRHFAPFSLDKVYPNPSREAARLLVDSDVERTIDIQIYDSGGRMVHAQRGRCTEGSTAITLDTSGMLPGYYQLIAIGEYGERLGTLPMQRL